MLLYVAYGQNPVYLSEAVAKQVKRVAAVTHQSEASIIRDALTVGLAMLKTPHRGNADVFAQLAQLGERLGVAGPADLATKHDAYLYDRD